MTAAALCGHRDLSGKLWEDAPAAWSGQVADVCPPMGEDGGRRRAILRAEGQAPIATVANPIPVGLDPGPLRDRRPLPPLPLPQFTCER